MNQPLLWESPFHESFLTGSMQEHVVQWHPTILTKLALVPQRMINSYGVNIESRGGKEVMCQEGDFVVRLVGCDRDENRNCGREMDPWYQTWKVSLKAKS